MNPNWLIRMAMLVRNPPPLWKVKLVLAVIGVALVIAGIEWLVGWPEALTPQRIRP